jgi:hypothetical protein
LAERKKDTLEFRKELRSEIIKINEGIENSNAEMLTSLRQVAEKLDDKITRVNSELRSAIEQN